MVRGLVMATVALLMAATSVDAGLFSRKNDCGCAAPVVSSCGDSCGGCYSARRVKVRKVKNRGCCNVAPSCGAPAPSCCAPAAPVCAPAPVCAAPAPTCCAPRATCCAPAPAACGACGTTSQVAPAAAGAPPVPVDGALGEAPKPAVVDTPAPPK